MLRNDLLLEESELQCLELQNLAMEINFFTERIEILERKISILLNTIDTNLLSIPGVNEISLAMLIGEIGDFNNFSSLKKLVAFAGVILVYMHRMNMNLKVLIYQSMKIDI
ncbi:transposase [Mollicutes bacterium LVI A0078]|nr:transposase [Mollicutes bacterium LVI A0075]WOO91006.1 transposase [Mollicutes bacterium LVI A0078]